MAETLAVLGAISSTAQLVDYTTKVFNRVKSYLRTVDEAPDMLRHVNLHLLFFIQALQLVQPHIDHRHFSPQASSMLQMIVDECASQMVLLDEIVTKLTTVDGDSKIIRGRKALESLKQEKNLEKIISRLSGYIEKLLLFQGAVTSGNTMANTKLVLSQWQHSAYMEAIATTSNTVSSSSGVLADTGETTTETAPRRVVSKSLASYSKRNNKRQFSYFIGLSRLGFFWALQMGLDITWGNSGLSITPSLHLQQLVKNTSPGFQLFYKSHMYQSESQSVCKELLELFRAGKVSPWDVFPDGRTWIERILSYPNPDIDLVVAFLRLLCTCGAPMETRVPLLSYVAGWNEVGHHLKLLKELLSLGYDCSADTFYGSEVPFGAFRSSVRGTVLPPLFFSQIESRGLPAGEREPFLLNFLTECSRNAYGVWGQTLLMDTILSGPMVEVSELLQNPLSLKGNNCLGQTAVHMAVIRPKILSMLLDLSPALDVHDIDGNSPLVYAAAYGKLESVILLLKAGADPLKDQHLDFLRHGMKWDHWNMITEVLRLFSKQRAFSRGFLQGEMTDILTDPLAAGIGHPQSERFGFLLELGADKHAIVKQEYGLAKEYTLLHWSHTRESAHVLLEAGFENIDQFDSKGHSPLMEAIWQRWYDAGDEILARGCRINLRNDRGQSALHTAFTRLMFRYSPGYIQSTSEVSPASLKNLSDDLAFIAKLLQHDADIWSPDNCRCPCSPGGCPPFLQLPRDQTSCYFPSTEGLAYLWVLEWLLILQDLRGTADVQRALQYFYRVREFESLGMTHVCCRKLGIGSLTCLYDEQVKLNGKEVDEILEAEEGLALELDEKIGRIMESKDGESVEEDWLNMLADFYVPNRLLKRYTWWVEWEPATGHIDFHSQNKAPLNPTLQAIQSTTDQQSEMRFFVIEEENDRYWEVRQEDKAPQHQVYTAWVEWFYRNRALYDYPIPVDSAWYEKRKYWAARQAEILEGLF